MNPPRTILFLGVLLGMIYVSYQNVASLAFLVPRGKMFVETSIKAVRVSINATTPLTKEEMSNHFTNMETIIQSHKRLPLFASSATMSTKYLNAIQPGETYLIMAKELFSHLYSFMNLKENLPPQSSCVYNYTLVEKAYLAEGVNYLLQKQLALHEAGLDTSIDNQAAVETFIGIFNSVCYDWYAHISTVISNLDVLYGLQFPENLKGHLETLSCLKGTNIEFEQITVISSTPGRLGLSIELDIGVPAARKEIVHLLPITYNGVQLRGEAKDVYFTGEVDTNKVKLLNCTTDNEWVNKKSPVCHEIAMNENCKHGLMSDDVIKVLKYCLFKYSNPPFAVRLSDNGILVQKTGLTVTNGGRAVYQAPPYVLYTKQEVKISLQGEELVIPALTPPMIESTVTSRLTAIDILAMTTKCYWDTLWFDFDYKDYLDWLALAIEGILLPLTLVGICLGVRNKVVRNLNERKLIKERRKRNLRETRALLRESRL